MPAGCGRARGGGGDGERRAGDDGDDDLRGSGTLDGGRGDDVLVGGTEPSYSVLLGGEGDDELRRRHPQHFGGPDRQRWLAILLTGGGVALLLFGMVRLGLLDARTFAGIGRLGEIVALMMPPSPGDWTHSVIGVVMVVAPTCDEYQTLEPAMLGVLEALGSVGAVSRFDTSAIW